METFDYVIIGSGSAGSVLTNRLSEDSNTTICVRAPLMPKSSSR